MKKKQVMQMSKDEAKKSLSEMNKELFNLKSLSIVGGERQKQKAKIFQVKKNISRLKTIINSK